MRTLVVPLFCLLLAACGADTKSPTVSPTPPDDYCHPCCPDPQMCGIPCVDCLPNACVVSADGKACCKSLRVPPDGGSLCPR